MPNAIPAPAWARYMMLRTRTVFITPPARGAFTVIKREGQDDYWLPIGAAFPHQNGDGYNVVLRALPIPDRDGQCKIVLRPPKDADDTERSQQTVREANDWRRTRDR
jgi:hypothetical protein